MDILRHLITFEIQTAKVCPYRLLFDQEFIARLKDTDQFKLSNIYFFCKVKKVRFDLSETVLLNKRTLKTTLIIGCSERKTITTSFFDLSQLFREIYETKEKYEDLVSDTESWDCKLIMQESTPTTLVFNQIETLTNQIFEFIITPEHFELDLDFSLNNPPEVIYIGQSFRLLDRIQNHKTLNKAVSKLSDNEDLRLFFLTFKCGYAGQEDLFGFGGDVTKVWLSQHGKTKEFKTKIDLVERVLIHFLKPILNEQHVNSEIQKDKIVKGLLLKNNITTVSVDYGMNGHAFQFWSSNRVLPYEIFTFDFTDSHKGYFVGLKK